MLENGEPQGLNLGSTQQPSAAVAAAAIPQRKPVSADSFRRLSALLKKPGSVPSEIAAPPQQSFAPAPPPVVVQVAPQPEPVVQSELAPAPIAAAYVEPELAPEPIIETAPEQELSPILEIEPVLPTPVQPQFELSPVFEKLQEPVHAAPPAWSDSSDFEIVPVFESAPAVETATSQPEVAPAKNNIVWPALAESFAEITPISVVEPTPEVVAKPTAWLEPSSSLEIEITPLSIEPVTVEPEKMVVPAFEQTASEALTIEPIFPDLMDLQPVGIVAPEPKIEFASTALTIEEEPALVELEIAAPEEIIVQVAESAPVSPLVDLQEALPEAEVVLAKTEVQANRPKPRDAFALPPSEMPKVKAKAATVPIVQTPEQEQEAAELARSLLDMMASGASSGLPQERALAADTLLRMVPRLPMKSMVMLAERLCMMEAPPHLLVTKLICDPRIEVAGPLLEECSHITDEDLSLVIQEGEPAKRRMMARRRHVGRSITAQLVNTGDPSVLLTLVRNQNVEISHESFVQLVEVAASQEELLAPLCIRADLPVPFAFELFWHAPAQLRRYLLSRFLTDSETLTKILKIALVTNGDDAAKPEFSNADKLMEALQLADDGQLDEAADILGAAAQINPATALRIMSDRQGEPLAAMFKAVGITRAAANEILHGLKNSISGLIDPARDPEELQGLFDSLSFNKARILLTYWDWATLKTGPYAPLN